jgi:hypothetical protein
MPVCRDCRWRSLCHTPQTGLHLHSVEHEESMFASVSRALPGVFVDEGRGILLPALAIWRNRASGVPLKALNG